MDKDILQKIIDNHGNYLVGNRKIIGFGRDNEDRWECVFISPSIDRKYWGKKIGELPFDSVKEIYDTEIRENIYSGKSYGPFQWGVKVGNFVGISEVTCDFNTLIHKCYEDNIKDYYKVLEVMESLSIKE